MPPILPITILAGGAGLGLTLLAASESPPAREPRVFDPVLSSPAGVCGPDDKNGRPLLDYYRKVAAKSETSPFSPPRRRQRQPGPGRCAALSQSRQAELPDHHRRARPRSAISTRACASPTASISRGAPRVPHGAQARSRLRDVLLGRGAGARAEHQCADGSLGGRAGGGGRTRRRREGRRRGAARTGADRRAGEALRGRSRRPTAPRSMRPMRRPWTRSRRASRRTTTSPALYAEALMDLSPWDYWEAGGATPKGRTAEIVAALEEVLTPNPDHPGAIHFYIHTVEASDRAGTRRALRRPPRRHDAGSRAPRAHAVHIYYRVGATGIARRQQGGGCGRRGLSGAARRRRASIRPPIIPTTSTP